MLSTVIPDEAIISLLSVILAAGGAALKSLWAKVSRLQAQVARLSVQLEIFRSCTAVDCPTRQRAERVRITDRTLGGEA
ncbi:MAG: hypothetical protein KA004_17390 [Verrucomicrobiales bacterium]|nr:hypothetical protein [Verrucomicrobiales bacterium]